MDENKALVARDQDEAGGFLGSRSLNHREFRLVEAYLGGKAPIDAAIAAGYAPTTARVKAHMILKKPHVRAEIQRRTTKATGITPDYILHSVHELASGAKSEQVRLWAWKLLGGHHGLWERSASGRNVPININIFKRDQVIEVDGQQVEDEVVGDQ